MAWIELSGVPGGAEDLSVGAASMSRLANMLGKSATGDSAASVQARIQGIVQAYVRRTGCIVAVYCSTH